MITPDDPTKIEKIVKGHWQVAVVLLLAWLGGAALVLWHWRLTPWAVREAELGGWSRSQALDLRALRASAVDWRPFPGLVLLAFGAMLGWVVAAGPLARRISRAMAWTLVGLAVVHLAEAWLAVQVVDNAQSGGAHLGVYVMWLQGAAFLAFALTPVAGVIAVLGGMTALARLVTRLVISARKPAPYKDEISGQYSEGTRAGDIRAGDIAHWHESSILPSDRALGGLGICLSGGGIRSATFALGALQALQKHEPLACERGLEYPPLEHPQLTQAGSELTRARYLAAVSGGAYAAGALLLAVRPPCYDPKTGTDRKPQASANRQDTSLGYDHIFAPGSPELDYLRRHSSYIADGFREWATAIFVVLRGALISTLFLALVTVIVARWTGFFYHEMGRQKTLESPWNPLWGPVFVTLGLALLALLLWLVSNVTAVSPDWREKLAEAAKMTFIPLVILILLGAVVPIVTWASMHIVNPGGGGLAAGGLANAFVKGGVVGAVGTVTAVLGLFNRWRLEVRKRAQSNAETPNEPRTWSARLGDVGSRMLHWMAVYAGLATVAAVYLILFGYTVHTSAEAAPGAHPEIRWGTPWWTLPLTNLGLTIALTGLLVVLYFTVDETAVGLHPFYRRRLASAFAVRRVTRDAATDQVPQHTATHKPAGYKAVPYPWKEKTALETYGAPELNGERLYPQVIFCASAHCSDPDMTPPGRHVLPFTFSYDAVGGPEVGWCKTKYLRERTGERLREDLTVQSAMAVSGAAFASAMGPYFGPANVILALTNARLGTWIANPKPLTAHDPQWWQARPPRIRRLSYLLREIFGWYPEGFPLVFVTDGGHYENLGLLELLRHRCREIYCFDASSDTETFAASLGRSITLALDELGVSVELHKPEQADPRTGGQQVEAGDLLGRLAETPIITAKVTYPPRWPGDTQTHAALVIGRATLDGETPWHIRRHAAAHPLFPHDAIGDQWFDDAKFNAYIGLGNHVGQRAIEAMAVQRSELPALRLFGSRAKLNHQNASVA